MDGMGLLWTLIIGALAGFLAGQLVKGRGFGALGIFTVGLIGLLIRSVIGAVILLVIIKAIKSA